VLRREAGCSFFFRLPEFDAIAFGIRDPGEAAVFVILDFLDGHLVSAELFEHAIHIRDAVIDRFKLTICYCCFVEYPNNAFDSPFQERRIFL
jgi:hypothetical protein